MNRILVNINSELSKLPNLQELLPKEFAAAEQLKEKGVLEHVFPKGGGKGAVLIFKDVEEQEAKELVASLPLAPYFGTIEYFPADKQF